MKRDIHKFSEWLEKTLRVGVADEQALHELKLSQKAAEPFDRSAIASAKAG